MNVCFCYLCQAECRENSVLQEVVGFTVLGKKTQKPCSTHSCLKSMQRHAPVVCLGALLMPPPRAVHVCTACRCCKQHLASWFLHLQCCTCEDAIKNSITISKSNSHSKCISILPSALLHELLQVDAESLHLYFMGICSPQYSVDCRDVKKMPRQLLADHTFMLCGLLCAGGSQTHIIPSALCTPCLS